MLYMGQRQAEVISDFGSRVLERRGCPRTRRVVPERSGRGKVLKARARLHAGVLFRGY